MRTEGPVEASYAPDRPPLGLCSDITRIRSEGVELRTPHRSPHTPGGTTVLVACLVGVSFPSTIHADPAAFVPTATQPDPPAPAPPGSPPRFRSSWDLDGTYLWLGPIGAASWSAAKPTSGVTDSRWDSTFGGDAAIVRVREREALGAIGGQLGASKWTVRGGGRLWLDAVVGTPVFGRMVGVSAGPIMELSDVAHPKFGGSIGLWGFVGVTPFFRVGVVEDIGTFAEIGVHIALPVIRR
jgi:hypothetical protein